MSCVPFEIVVYKLVENLLDIYKERVSGLIEKRIGRAERWRFWPFAGGGIAL